MDILIFRPEDNVSEKECVLALDNSVDYYILVLNAFFKEAPKILSEMMEYAQDKDQEHYRITVHGLKSTSLSVGFKQLSESARISEMCCKSNDFDGAMKRHDALCNELKDTIELINIRIQEYEEKTKQ